MKHLMTLSALLIPFVFAAPVAAQSFGQAVAVAGDEVLIGQPSIDRVPGSIFVYRNSGGTWMETAEVRAEDAFPGDRFGSSIAVDGERMLVGAFWADSGPGAAYVFERSDGAWRQSAKLMVEERSPGDSLGLQVALHGDIALVTSANGPAIHVFRRDEAGNWRAVGKLAAEGLTLGDFTSRPAIAFMDGDAVVGVPAKDSLSGEVLIFPAEGDDFGRPIVLSSPAAGGRFGGSVAVVGNQLLIGAPTVNRGQGAVFVYSNEGGEWREIGRIDGPELALDDGAMDGSPPPLFGAGVVAAEDEALVGAIGMRNFGGALFRLTRGEDGWTRAEEVEGLEIQQGDFLGGALALGGGLAVAGVPGDDYGSGTAAILEGSGEGWRVAARVASELEPLPAVVGGEVRCEDGTAGLFTCDNVDLLAFIPIDDIGGGRGVELSGIWGWTDPETGHEYALVGRVDGTAFVDVTDPSTPIYVGQLPQTRGSPPSIWREIKVYSNHVFIVSDNAGEHGMQVFDLTRLRDVKAPPASFTPDTTYHRIHSAHNIVINTDSGFAYSVGNSDGGETCGGGLHMIDIREPKNPKFAGCFADPSTGLQKTGYTHDAQCVVYRGPDEEYQGREICFGSNETALSIADVTDKANPRAVAVAEYPNVGYTHQTWLTEDQRHMVMDDELDELNGLVDHTRTLIWDVSDLDDPVLIKEYFNPNTTAIDHNQYIVGDKVYQSNYVAGLRILDISDIENPRELGYFDTVPYGSDGPRFDGSWGNYPFFESGIIVVSSGDEGLFLLRYRPEGDRPIS